MQIQHAPKANDLGDVVLFQALDVDDELVLGLVFDSPVGILGQKSHFSCVRRKSAKRKTLPSSGAKRDSRG